MPFLRKLKDQFFKNFHLYLLLITAFLLRTYRLKNIPPAPFIDEYNLSLETLKQNLGLTHIPFFSFKGWYGTPGPFIHYLSTIFRILKPSVAAFKIAWLLLSFPTLIFTYLFTKKIFGKGAAFISLIFLSFSYIQIHLSRFAHGAIIVPTFFMASLYLALVLKKSPRLLYMIFSALSVVAPSFIYPSGRILTLSSAIATNVIAFASPKKLKYFLRYNLILLIISAPLIYQIVYYPQDFFLRFNEIFIWKNQLPFKTNLARLYSNSINHLFMLLNLPHPSVRHNPLSVPLFSKPIATFFFFSLLYLLVTNRRIFFLFSFLLLSTLLPGILTYEFPSTSPSIFRTTAVIPLVYTLSGAGIYVFGKILARIRRLNPTFAISFFTSIVVLFQVLRLNYYFKKLSTPDQSIQGAFTKTEFQIAKLAVSKFSSGYEVYLSPTFFWYSSVQFEALSKFKKIPFKLYNINAEIASPKSFLILEKDYATLKNYFTYIFEKPRIQEYPGFITLSSLNKKGPNPAPITTFYLVSGKIEKQEKVPTIYYAWPEKEPVNTPNFSAFWETILKVKESSEYIIEIYADDMASLLLKKDKLILISTQPTSYLRKRVNLQSQAEYYFRIDYQNLGGAKFIKVYLYPENSPRKILSPFLLKSIEPNPN